MPSGPLQYVNQNVSLFAVIKNNDGTPSISLNSVYSIVYLENNHFVINY